MLDNIGIPNSGINLSLSDGSLMSPADGEILISLNEDHHPTAELHADAAQAAAEQFPDLTFFFAPADIVTQVLNFGIAAPIDMQVVGPLADAAEERRDRAGHPPAMWTAIPGRSWMCGCSRCRTRPTCT